MGRTWEYHIGPRRELESITQFSLKIKVEAQTWPGELERWLKGLNTCMRSPPRPTSGIPCSTPSTSTVVWVTSWPLDTAKESLNLTPNSKTAIANKTNKQTKHHLKTRAQNMLYRSILGDNYFSLILWGPYLVVYRGPYAVLWIKLDLVSHKANALILMLSLQQHETLVLSQISMNSTHPTISVLCSW